MYSANFQVFYGCFWNSMCLVKSFTKLCTQLIFKSFIAAFEITCLVKIKTLTNFAWIWWKKLNLLHVNQWLMFTKGYDSFQNQHLNAVFEQKLCLLAI